MVCEQAGADGITVHIRGDRRHIQDADLFVLRQAVTTYLNVEMAATEEMLKIVIDVGPDAVSLVPENPREITTEGGLNVRTNIAIVRAAVGSCANAASWQLFSDTTGKIEAAREVNPSSRVMHSRVCRSDSGRDGNSWRRSCACKS